MSASTPSPAPHGPSPAASEGASEGASGHRPPRWREVARATGLLRPDGAVAGSVFTEMSALAERTGAINLGQGFPDADGPSPMLRAASDAILGGVNQYPPAAGIASLREAIARHQHRRYGLVVDPDTEVLVTTGATEALTAAVLALAGPGDEVLTLEPSYDSYAAAIALAGATHTTAALRPSEDPLRPGFRLDVQAVEAAFGPRTRILLLNTPHNPTGAVLERAELEVLAALARRHDAVVLTDEVYEHLVFDEARHVPIATLPGMAARTLTVSSAGKTFSATGWKVGWVHGPADLVEPVRTVKQYLTFASGAPFQPAVAMALDDDAAPASLAASLAGRRDLLCAGLARAGLDVIVPQGTYFAIADGRAWGYPDGAELCRSLPRLAGVVAVPVSAFCRPGSPAADRLRPLVRFAFCKRPEVLEEAVRRLRTVRR